MNENMTIEEKLEEALELLGFSEANTRGLWQLEQDEHTLYVDFRPGIGNKKGRRYVKRTKEGEKDTWITKTEELEEFDPLKKFKAKRDELIDMKNKKNAMKEPDTRLPIQNESTPARMETPYPTEITQPAASHELIREAPASSQQHGFLQASVSIDEAVNAFELYEQAKAKLLKPSDILWIGENGLPVPAESKGANPYITKSGWRKLGRFFGLSTEVLSREKIWTTDENNKKYYIWSYRVKVSHQCGAFVITEGVCTSKDKFFTKGGRKIANEQNVMLKAQTVAINRGISDLLGSGEVSSEEMGVE